MGERRGTKALELWCRRVTEGYPGVKVDNMTTSWRDGLAFCALIHHFRPDLIDFPSLKKEDVYRNNELAFRTAESYLGIPALLDAEDMAQHEVPDRLSILTYLSQYYQHFASTSSPSRIITKRDSPKNCETDSPSSASPPTKMMRSGGLSRREPCVSCNQPVFLAQRLMVDRNLYHRTCFRCARCNAQLSLVDYYQTESGQYCCETCPDEERDTNDTFESVVSETSEQPDDSITTQDSNTSMQSYDSSQFKTPKPASLAFAGFMNDHFNAPEEDLTPISFSKDSPTNCDKLTEPVSVSDTNIVTDSEPNNDNADKAFDEIFKETFGDDDEFKKITDEVQPDVERPQPPITDEHVNTDKYDINVLNLNTNPSLVKTRMKFFEIDDIKDNNDKNRLSLESRESIICNDNLVSEETDLPDVNPAPDEIKPAEELKQDTVESHVESVTPEDVTNAVDQDANKIDSDAEDVVVGISTQAITKTVSTNSNSSKSDLYPDHLDPFFEEDEEERPQETEPPKEKRVSLNPFGSESENEDEPMDNVKKKSKEKPPRPPPPKISINLYQEKQPEVKSYDPRLNPFSSDEEDDDSLPTSIPRISDVSASSISSTTRRKKAPAPKPPDSKSNDGDSISSANSYTNLASLSPLPPKGKAPLPPSLPVANSTPLMRKIEAGSSESLNTSERHTLNLSGSKKVISAEEFDDDPDISIHVKDLSLDDKKEVSRDSLSSDKSMSGQWKRRKGPAPAIPILQRNNPIPMMPLSMIRKKLQLLEAQQRGLERQGVRLEEMIRERCEKSGPEEVSTEPDPETDELVLQLFELVNEKNELFRQQAELMYIRRQQRLEEEHADLDHQIRVLMSRPEANRTDADKVKEEQLIQRLIEVVERRNEVITCLEMDRIREKEEDLCIRERMASHRANRDKLISAPAQDASTPKKKKKWTLKDKKKADKSDSVSPNPKKKQKKWF